VEGRRPRAGASGAAADVTNLSLGERFVAFRGLAGALPIAATHSPFADRDLLAVAADGERTRN
jgi:hypothetical protein